MAEGQILFDVAGVGWPDQRGFVQGPAAFRALVLQQMALARATAQDFAWPVARISTLVKDSRVG